MLEKFIKVTVCYRRSPFQIADTGVSQELSPNPAWASFNATSLIQHKQLSD
jgi:hypothetical protein